MPKSWPMPTAMNMRGGRHEPILVAFGMIIWLYEQNYLFFSVIEICAIMSILKIT